MAYDATKWGSLFPAIIGNEERPTDAINNTLDFETDAFPQRMANDPVRYDLENAMASQLFSNDERLKEDIEKSATAASDDLTDALAAHNKDVTAHADIRQLVADTVRVTTTANKPDAMADNGLWCEIVS